MVMNLICPCDEAARNRRLLRRDDRRGIDSANTHLTEGRTP